MVLEYLDFDHSEEAGGAAGWDALASVLPERLPAALREVQAVLAWAHGAFDAPHESDAEMGDWSFDLHCAQDHASGASASVDLGLQYDAADQRLHHQASDPRGGRCTLSLSLCGSATFAQAFADAFASG